MDKKPWDKLTVEEKIDALRADIMEIVNFVNPIAQDVRQLTARLSEVAAKLDGLHKTIEGSNQP